MYDPRRRVRDPRLRRLAPLAGDAARGADRRPGSVSLRGARRQGQRRRELVRAGADQRGRAAPRGAAAGGVRARRALRAGTEPRRDRARGDPARREAVRARARFGALDVPLGSRRPPSGQRNRGQGRPRAVHRPPPRQERGGAGGDPPGPARRRRRDGSRPRAPARRRAAERRPGRRRRAADLRAPQARGRAGLHRARRLRGRVHRLARRPDRDRPRHGLRPDRAERADLPRPLPARPRVRLLRGHDPHLRRRRALRRAARVPQARSTARSRPSSRASPART